MARPHTAANLPAGATVADAPRPTDGRTRAWNLFAAAVAVRVALLALPFAVRDTTWEHFLGLSDAGAYRDLARVLQGSAAPDTLGFYASRVFPGWPALVAVAALLVPLDAAMVALSLACAGLLPVLCWRMTGCAAAAWLLVFAPPAWLLASTHPIAEPAFLLASLAALAAAQRSRWLGAGLLAGAACVIKPYGCFVVAGLLAATLVAGPRAWSRPLQVLAAAAVLPAALLVLNVRLFGDPLHQFHVYGAALSALNLPADVAAKLHAPHGHWGVPFRALIETPLVVGAPAWKTLYIFAHVPVLAVLVLRGLRRARRADETARAWQTAAAVWAALNALAIVCGGPYWGFHSFDRYFVWAWPALLLLNADLLARRDWLVWPLSAASVAATAFALLNKPA